MFMISYVKCSVNLPVSTRQGKTIIILHPWKKWGGAPQYETSVLKSHLCDEHLAYNMQIANSLIGASPRLKFYRKNRRRGTRKT